MFVYTAPTRSAISPRWSCSTPAWSGATSRCCGSGPDGEKQLAGILAGRPHLHYVEGRYRGYFVVDLTRERLQADFYGVATVRDRSTKEKFEKGFVTESGRNHLVQATTPALAAKAPDPAP